MSAARRGEATTAHCSPRRGEVNYYRGEKSSRADGTTQAGLSTQAIRLIHGSANFLPDWRLNETPGRVLENRCAAGVQAGERAGESMCCWSPGRRARWRIDVLLESRPESELENRCAAGVQQAGERAGESV